MGIRLKLNEIEIISKPTINVLDSKLQWSPHANHCIKKSLKALHATRLIKPPFNDIKLKQLITSNFTIVCTSMQKFGTCPVSTLTSKTVNIGISKSIDRSISFKVLHTINSRATSQQFPKI
jgi:hypothetical protein